MVQGFQTINGVEKYDYNSLENLPELDRFVSTEPQQLTDEEKAQGRENLGIIGSGKDGFSPSINAQQTDTGAIISITDKDGTTTVQILNGEQGPQGPSGPNPKKLNFTGAVTANYDGSEEVTVQIPEGGGGLTKTLLWSNSAGYSSFPAQTITLNNFSQYDGFEVIFSEFTIPNQVIHSTGFLPKPADGWESGGAIPTYVLSATETMYGYPSWRTVNLGTDSLSIGEGMFFNNGREDTNDNSIIPLLIYGIKGVE